MRRTAFLVPVLAGVLVACGTPLPLTSRQAGGVVSPTGTTDTADAPGVTQPSAVPGAVDASDTQRPGGVLPSPSALPLASLSAAVTTRAVGVTDKEILLGAVVLKNGEAFANGLGFSISFGDARKEFTAVADDINRRGGVAGRKLRLVFAEYDLSGAAIDPESLQAGICATFTQDHHVFAAFMPYNPLPSFLECMAKRKTLLLNGSALGQDDAGYQQLAGWHIAPSQVSYSRYSTTLVRELVAHGFFSTPRPVKAGILLIDEPLMVRAAERSMKPAIEAAGVAVPVVTRVSSGQSSTAEINNAVLQFKAAGITHVFFLQAAGGLPLYFMQGADSQQYFPRYALSSWEVPGFFLEGNAPATQLANAMGIGWEPFFDVKAAQFPSRPAEKRCFEIVRAGGEVNTNRQSNLTVTPVCDMVWLFAAAAAKAGRSLDHAGWLAGLRAVGGFDSPVALRADFSGGRPDGAAGYRWISYVSSCPCFRYAGPQKNGWE
jgi:hypothetical protein